MEGRARGASFAWSEQEYLLWTVPSQGLDETSISSRLSLDENAVSSKLFEGSVQSDYFRSHYAKNSSRVRLSIQTKLERNISCSNEKP